MQKCIPALTVSNCKTEFKKQKNRKTGKQKNTMKTNGKGRNEELKIKRIKLIAISKTSHCVFFAIRGF